MTIFIITSHKYPDGGYNLELEAKSDFGSPSQIELGLLAEYLTPKGLDLLQQQIAAQLAAVGGTQPASPSDQAKP